MANEEHLQKLLAGLEVWNAWRATEAGASVRPDLSGATLANARLMGADLAGADLMNANLQGAKLMGAHLSGADLTHANLRDANLSDAQLWVADLTNANLRHAILANADLMSGTLKGAKLVGTDLTGANLVEADLSGAQAASVKYDRKRMRNRYRGALVATMDGDPIFKRDAQDQVYLDAMEECTRRSPWKRVLFRLWGITDFGRDLGSVGVFALAVVFLFGCIYLADYAYLKQLFHFRDVSLGATALTPFYYSVVTFTTLGFGDVYPKHWLGEVIVMTEVILGYLSLGLLISVLENVVARRA
jgi:hypothetical protein